MSKNDTKLMESVIVLAEELHFGRAARRLRISQPMLTKNIQDVEALIGGPLFLRDRKHVVLSDAGRAYVQQARLSLLYGERAVQSARAVMQSMDETFHVGRTPYADPFLVSTLLSI
jgi:DNA-binding transcriptional LysR family regulator